MSELFNKCNIEINYNFTTPCLLWTGRKSKDGYGKINRKGKTLSAHRYSWTLVNGPIPEGLFVLHKCDVPTCINPDHLFLGTHQDNMDDMKNKGRATNANTKKTHCKYGHKLEGDNLMIYRNNTYNKNMRQCRQCSINRRK